MQIWNSKRQSRFKTVQRATIARITLQKLRSSTPLPAWKWNQKNGLIFDKLQFWIAKLFHGSPVHVTVDVPAAIVQSGLTARIVCPQLLFGIQSGLSSSIVLPLLLFGHQRGLTARTVRTLPLFGNKNGLTQELSVHCCSLAIRMD